MISAIVGTLLGSAVQLVLLVLGLLPTIDVSALPVAVPDSVRGVLSTLNWFVPFGDLVGILTVWIGLVLALNVALAVAQVVSIVSR
ncbi:hypothetical protein [Adlercreutzia mucosicola]|uniref:hypothetical protein n=1 Tax=Adlercreutzia mucosicola TaxID=580026 RepID=UPI000417E7EC|nr:hypothetical protein [Adlercreutzia mucosicola]MCR2036159.1 hypothetical protein [Adlercreutzia mucosicola]